MTTPHYYTQTASEFGDYEITPDGITFSDSRTGVALGPDEGRAEGGLDKNLDQHRPAFYPLVPEDFRETIEYARDDSHPDRTRYNASVRIPFRFIRKHPELLDFIDQRPELKETYRKALYTRIQQSNRRRLKRQLVRQDRHAASANRIDELNRLSRRMGVKSASDYHKSHNADVIRTAVDDVVNTMGGGDRAKRLMYGIAGTESRYGTDPGTHAPRALIKNGPIEPYYGGIFQIDPKGFEDTQNTKSHRSLTRHYKTIQDAYGIDWPSQTWKDMRSPLKSALAARLLLLNKGDPIPATRWGRAKYWKDHYNGPTGKGKIEDYLKRSDPDFSAVGRPRNTYTT